MQNLMSHVMVVKGRELSGGRPEPTVSPSVSRANNHVAATALRVMCTDVIRLATACHQTRWAFWELPLSGGRSCRWDVAQEKGGDCLVEFNDRPNYVFLLFQSETRLSCEVARCIVHPFMAHDMRRVEPPLFCFRSCGYKVMPSSCQNSFHSIPCWAWTQRTSLPNNRLALC